MIANNAATGLPETILSTGGAIHTTSAADSSVGSPADAAASSDTGTFSLIALIKRLLTKTPSFGQAAMAASVPVAIASNQSAVPVSGTVTANIGTGSLAAGTNVIGDVGIQVRANATGAASTRHLIAAATTNLANVKNAAGRVLGWSLANTTAAWVYLKFHNLTTVPVAGAAVFLTVGIPPNGKSEVMLPAGIAFSTGIGISTTTGAADTDTVAVAANSIVGDIWFA